MPLKLFIRRRITKSSECPLCGGAAFYFLKVFFVAKVNITKHQYVWIMKTINFGIFNSAFTLMQVFNTEKKCIRYLESKLWKNSEPVSPYDPTSKVYRRGNGMYRCKNTGKNFNIRIGTLFDGSKISLRKWFYAVYMVTCQTKGISSVQLSKDIHVTQKTAWFMTHRIREAFISKTTRKSLTVRLNLMKHSLVARTKTAIGIRKRRNAKAEHSLIKFP